MALCDNEVHLLHSEGILQQSEIGGCAKCSMQFRMGANVLKAGEDCGISACRMWSAWMFTVPSLRARDCPAAEKDALNILFILIPLLNVGLPFIWKSFPFIFSADVVALAAIYTWKIGIPFQSKA